MPKRFTATEKWDDPWFFKLSKNDKLFWVFILDRCSHAGVWQVNWEVVKTYITGFTYNPEAFKGRIVEITSEKWHIPKFIEFQYGTLNPLNRAHASVISVLEKEGASKDLASPYLGAKDKEQDKDMDKDKRGPRGDFVKPTPDEVGVYAKSIGFVLDGQEFWDHYESNGWKVGRTAMKNWKAAVRTWKRSEFRMGDKNANHDSKGVSVYGPIARAARETQGLRKITSPRELLAGIPNMPDVQSETEDGS